MRLVAPMAVREGRRAMTIVDRDDTVATTEGMAMEYEHDVLAISNKILVMDAHAQRFDRELARRAEEEDVCGDAAKKGRKVRVDVEYVASAGRVKSVTFFAPTGALIEGDDGGKEAGEESLCKVDVAVVEGQTSWEPSYWLVQVCWRGQARAAVVLGGEGPTGMLAYLFGSMGRELGRGSEALQALQMVDGGPLYVSELDGETAATAGGSAVGVAEVLLMHALGRGVCASNLETSFHGHNFRVFCFSTPEERSAYERTVWVCYVGCAVRPYFAVHAGDGDTTGFFPEGDNLVTSVWKWMTPMTSALGLPVAMRRVSGLGLVYPIEGPKSELRTLLKSRAVDLARERVLAAQRY